MKKSNGKVWIALTLILSGLLIGGISRLPKHYRFTVYRFTSEYVEIITAERELKNGYVVRLASDIWIKTVSGKGEWKLESLPELAKKINNNWLDDTMSEVVGNGNTFFYNRLSWGDRFTIWRFLRRADVKFINVENAGGIVEKTAPDGEKIKSLGDRWYQIKKQVFFDSRIAGEEVYVIVENASGIEGAGTLAAESIDIAGAQVFDVTKSDTKIQRCRIQRNKNLAKSYLVAWLGDRFECEVEDSDNEMIVVKIGTEWGEKIKDFL